MITAVMVMAVVAATDYIGISAMITAAATGIGTLVGAMVVLIKSIKDLKHEQQDTKREVQDLHKLNTQEHGQNADRIENVRDAVLARLDHQDDVIDGVITQVSDLDMKVEEAMKNDETILVLIEELEGERLGRHLVPTVTKVPLHIGSGGE